MNGNFSIISRLNEAIESLDKERYTKCRQQLKQLVDDIEKFNIDKNLSYMSELENSLK